MTLGGLVVVVILGSFTYSCFTDITGFTFNAIYDPQAAKAYFIGWLVWLIVFTVILIYSGMG